MRVVCFTFETLKHISNTTVIIESDRFDLNFFLLSHARLIFFPVLHLIINAQPQWFMSNRVSDDVEAATVRAGAGGNLNSTRLRSHRKAITDITDACAGDPKFIFTIKLKKKCELRLTDRDDMGYATGVTAEVVYYKHGNPYFQPYQALGHNLPICVLHLNLLVELENTGNPLMSPQGDRVAAGVGRPGGPPPPSQSPMYHYQPPLPPPGY